MSTTETHALVTRDLVVGYHGRPLLLAANAPRAMLIAALAGAVMGALGYFIAFRYGFPAGASQSLVGLVLVLAGNGFAWFMERGTTRNLDVTAPGGNNHPGHANHGHAHSSSEHTQK